MRIVKSAPFSIPDRSGHFAKTYNHDALTQIEDAHYKPQPEPFISSPNVFYILLSLNSMRQEILHLLVKITSPASPRSP